MIPYLHGCPAGKTKLRTPSNALEKSKYHSSIIAIKLRTKKYASKRAVKHKNLRLEGTSTNNRDFVAKYRLFLVVAKEHWIEKSIRTTQP